jgi:hypothetical protein
MNKHGITILTLQTLIEKGACANQVDLFRLKFGESVEVTEELCVSVAHDFDFGWAGRQLLSPAARRAYEKAETAAGRAYEKAEAPAWCAYEKAKAAAWRAYEKAKAAAFARAYIRDAS